MDSDTSSRVQAMNSTKKVMKEGLIRLNKLIASSGACSRREADRYLANGWVQVQGLSLKKSMVPGTKVAPRTAFTFLDKAKDTMDRSISVILHKPVGVVSCQPESATIEPAIRLLTATNWHHRTENTDMESFRSNPCLLHKLAVAGRLDATSSGLLLFTQEGRLARHVIGEGSHIEKEYLVRLTHRLEPSRLLDSKIRKMIRGVQCGNDLLDAKDICLRNESQLQFVLTGGKNHHIRRMCEAVGWKVQGIKRMRIGPIALGSLAPGNWRYITKEEKNAIMCKK